MLLIISRNEDRPELESKILAAAFRQSVERGDIDGSRLAHRELVGLLAKKAKAAKNGGVHEMDRVYASDNVRSMDLRGLIQSQKGKLDAVASDKARAAAARSEGIANASGAEPKSVNGESSPLVETILGAEFGSLSDELGLNSVVPEPEWESKTEEEEAPGIVLSTPIFREQFVKRRNSSKDKAGSEVDPVEKRKKKGRNTKSRKTGDFELNEEIAAETPGEVLLSTEAMLKSFEAALGTADGNLSAAVSAELSALSSPADAAHDSKSGEAGALTSPAEFSPEAIPASLSELQVTAETADPVLEADSGSLNFSPELSGESELTSTGSSELNFGSPENSVPQVNSEDIVDDSSATLSDLPAAAEHSSPELSVDLLAIPSELPAIPEVLPGDLVEDSSSTLPEFASFLKVDPSDVMENSSSTLPGIPAIAEVDLPAMDEVAVSPLTDEPAGSPLTDEVAVSPLMDEVAVSPVMDEPAAFLQVDPSDVMEDSTSTLPGIPVLSDHSPSVTDTSYSELATFPPVDPADVTEDSTTTAHGLPQAVPPVNSSGFVQKSATPAASTFPDIDDAEFLGLFEKSPISQVEPQDVYEEQTSTVEMSVPPQVESPNIWYEQSAPPPPTSAQVEPSQQHVDPGATLRGMPPVSHGRPADYDSAATLRGMAPVNPAQPHSDPAATLRGMAPVNPVQPQSDPAATMRNLPAVSRFGSTEQSPAESAGAVPPADYNSPGESNPRATLRDLRPISQRLAEAKAAEPSAHSTQENGVAGGAEKFSHSASELNADIAASELYPHIDLSQQAAEVNPSELAADIEASQIHDMNTEAEYAAEAPPAAPDYLDFGPAGETYADIDFGDFDDVAHSDYAPASIASMLAQREAPNPEAEGFYPWISAESTDPFFLLHVCYLRAVRRLLMRQYGGDKSKVLNPPDFKRQLRNMGIAFNILSEPNTRLDFDLRQLGLREPDTFSGLKIPADARLPESGGKVKIAFSELLILCRIFDSEQMLAIVNAARLLSEQQFWTYLADSNLLTEVELDSIKSGFQLVCNGLVSIVQFEQAFVYVRANQQQLIEICLAAGWLRLDELQEFAEQGQETPEAPKFIEAKISNEHEKPAVTAAAAPPANAVPSYMDWGDADDTGVNESAQPNPDDVASFMNAAAEEGSSESDEKSVKKTKGKNAKSRQAPPAVPDEES